jgi:hypothetical protein
MLNEYHGSIMFLSYLGQPVKWHRRQVPRIHSAVILRGTQSRHAELPVTMRVAMYQRDTIVTQTILLMPAYRTMITVIRIVTQQILSFIVTYPGERLHRLEPAQITLLLLVSITMHRVNSVMVTCDQDEPAVKPVQDTPRVIIHLHRHVTAVEHDIMYVYHRIPAFDNALIVIFYCTEPALLSALEMIDVGVRHC